MKIQESANEGLEIIAEDDFEKAIISHVLSTLQRGVRIRIEPDDTPRRKVNPALVETEFENPLRQD